MKEHTCVHLDIYQILLRDGRSNNQVEAFFSLTAVSVTHVDASQQHLIILRNILRGEDTFLPSDNTTSCNAL